MFGTKDRKKLRELAAERIAIGRSQAMATFSLDGKILTANENFLNIMGYTLAELVGQHHGLFMPEDERDGAEYRQFWNDLGQGVFRTGSFHRLAKGKRDVWLQASYNPVLGPGGKPTKVVTIASDITEACLRTADYTGQIEAIRRSEAVIEFNLDGTIITANENFLRLMDYSLAEIVGQHHSMFVPAEERDSPAYGKFWLGLRSGKPNIGEFRRLAKGGREVWLSATYDPILDPHGKPFKLVKFGTDVTAARQESLVRKAELEAMNRAQAVIEFGTDGTILTANENFLSAAGYSLAEIVGKNHAIFVDPAERDSQDYRDFWKSLAAGEFRSGEFKRLRKDGTPLWLRATYSAICDLNGKPYKVVKFASDVTGQANAREGFSNLLETVGCASHQLTASIAEISAAMAQSQETAGTAVQRVAEAGEATQRLNAAAQAMGRVVELITRITRQINMLALNATIESARAGEAGRGFAVVANEVKNLATQARSATEEITREIDGIRALSGDVVKSLSAIKQAIEYVSTFVTSTAAAVKEQSNVTGSISNNMNKAAEQACGLWAS